MAKVHAFKVSENKHTDPVEFKIELPTTIEDEDLIVQRFGTVERMIDRACSQLTVDVATGMRKRMPDNDAAQIYADGYCNDGSRDGYTRPKIDADTAADEADFTDEQIAWLRLKNLVA